MLPGILRTFSWPEFRRHPWRSAAAAVAVTLGVALAFSVHLINASALSEFASGVRAAGGQPDLELRAVATTFDEALFARVASDRRVAAANPVLEIATFARAQQGRVPIRVIGVDALAAAAVAPALMPVPHAGAERLSIFAPSTVFLNASARQAIGDARVLSLQDGPRLLQARVGGTVAAPGAPLAVMDIGAAQDLFARQGQLSRIDMRLAEGVAPAAFLASVSLPQGVVASDPTDASQRVASLSRAYRVNLTVLALVALFTGSFLVYSVLALAVARRAQQFALLGVLGVTGRQRKAIVLAESVMLGALGSAAGIALGAALAFLGLERLGGDLGGGYFSSVSPALQWSTPAALSYGLLGVLAAAAGGWLPARAAARLPLAQSLKGLGGPVPGTRAHGASLALLAAGAAAALLPPVAGIPLGAYFSVGLLLVGGITGLPWVIGALYDKLAPRLQHRALPLLAIERARRVRESAAVAVSGVVAALSLAIALTVMVASFRESVSRWLDVVLPADLYGRAASQAASAEAAWFPPEFVAAIEALPGVARISAQRTRQLQLDPSLPAVALLARTLAEPARTLPLVGETAAAPAGTVAIYVSEAVADLYGARVGQAFPPLSMAFPGSTFFVAGIWRDYVRQSGAIAIARADYERLTGDQRINDFQLWLAPGADASRVQQEIRSIGLRVAGAAGGIEFSSASELRATSLRIFDRSFAVTYWLQAVAIGIGLFGVAASFSAQVLARRKEFGLLAHLGLTRRQVLGVVAGEGLAWTAMGALAGLVLGLAVSVVLVHVVNPQSFHWTMDLLVPWLRLALLCLAVVASGTLTAWLAGRAAATRDAVLAVKEDW